MDLFGTLREDIAVNYGLRQCALRYTRDHESVPAALIIGITGNHEGPLIKVDGVKPLVLPIGHEDILGVCLGPTATAAALWRIGMALLKKKPTDTAARIEAQLRETLKRFDDFWRLYGNIILSAPMLHATAAGAIHAATDEGVLKVVEMSGRHSRTLNQEEFMHGNTHGVDKDDALFMFVATNNEFDVAVKTKNGFATRSVRKVIIIDPRVAENVSMPHKSDFVLSGYKANTFVSAVDVCMLMQLTAVKLAIHLEVDPAALRYPQFFMHIGTKVVALPAEAGDCKFMTPDEMAAVIIAAASYSIVLSDADGTVVPKHLEANIDAWPITEANHVKGVFAEANKVLPVGVNTGRYAHVFEKMFHGWTPSGVYSTLDVLSATSMAP